MTTENEKLNEEIMKFRDDFIEDLDNLNEEERSIRKGKYKPKLKYKESFDEHWEKKFKDFMNKARQQGIEIGLKRCITCKAEQYKQGRKDGFHAGFEQGKFDKKMDKLLGRKLKNSEEK